MYTVVTQIINVICTAVPATVNDVGGFIYVSIPQNLRVKRISIYYTEDPIGVVPSALGGFSTNRSLDARNYIGFEVNQGVGRSYPLKLEVTNPNDVISTGFYLAVITQNVGDGATFGVIFEGEQ